MEEIEERYGDSPGSRLRSLLFVTQRSDKRRCGALAASQGNHQGFAHSKPASTLGSLTISLFVTESLVKKPVVL